ncbi:MAG: molecular chaperone [Chryseobacterium sp.]|nr:MAG: molecular chaperone [Chryseobacterium sp.]
MKRFLQSVFLCLAFLNAKAQVGISVSPPRTYFHLNGGQSEVKSVTVTNVSSAKTLDLSVSFNDWKYDENGNNIISPPTTLPTSSADWMTVSKPSFRLSPGESYDLEVRMTVPFNANTEPVHTTMMYITQTNPQDAVDEQGKAIRVYVRSGVKIYRRRNAAHNTNVEFISYRYDRGRLQLSIENDGDIWADGTINTDLVNTETGETSELKSIAFYTMPGDKRKLSLQLPEELEKGKYTAISIMNCEATAVLKVAEFNFVHL